MVAENTKSESSSVKSLFVTPKLVSLVVHRSLSCATSSNDLSAARSAKAANASRSVSKPFVALYVVLA